MLLIQMYIVQIMKKYIQQQTHIYIAQQYPNISINKKQQFHCLVNSGIMVINK